MKKNNKYLIYVFFISLLFIFNNIGLAVQTSYISDFDPLSNIKVTVDIQKIRAFDKDDQQVRVKEYIDLNSDPDFYVKIIINDEVFISDIWHDTKYIYEPCFNATLDVPDDEEIVTVVIQLWDWNDNEDVLCDIGDETDDAELHYSIKNGHWTGDDQINDASGYGRLNGCDDGSIYTQQYDCELWFSITQNDYDNDGIPYWMEVNTYGTDPEVKNSGDPDGDKIPVDWEWKWGYNPFEAESHEQLDPDDDSIDNYEEYLTSEWFSDPFRIDVFVELDMMGDGPNGEKVYFPEYSEELLNTAFNRQNFVFHLDYGDMGGHEIIPFDSESTYSELNNIYWNYFMHGDEDNWRRGIFHYGIITYDVDGPPGYMIRSNAFQVASLGMEGKVEEIPTSTRETVYASCYMHELGHTFNFRPIPGHDQDSAHPWQIGYWINRPYKSCMNYAWTYRIVDYSDGSRPDPDLNDWDTNRLKLDSFEREWD